MTDTDLHILVVPVAASQAEELGRWITDLLGATPVEIVDLEGNTTSLDIYFDAEVEAQLAGSAIQKAWCITGWSIRPCPREDWAESWKQHFYPMHIGEHLWVCPPWHEDPPPADDLVTLIINPGLSFGTGQHFTTRFCLAEVETALREYPDASLLDAGVGSGILSVAALMLGAGHVAAVDNDPQCMEQVTHNLALNGLQDRLTPQVLDVTRDPLPEPFDLVFANIYDPLLIKIASRLVPCASKRLVLSGIRTPELDKVAEAYVGQGAVELRRDADHEWAGLVLAPPA